MAKGDIAAFRIEELSAGGSGLARADGRFVFADYTAPGDLVKLIIKDEQKGWAKGVILEILEPSMFRIEAPCPLYGKCGGCNLQHINYEAQLAAKEDILKASFSRIGGIETPAISVRASIPWDYRNRVQFHCQSGNRKIIGFMGKKARTVIPLNDCSASDPGIRKALSGNIIVPPPHKDRFNVYSKDDIFLSEGTNSRGRITLGSNPEISLNIDAGVFFQSNARMLELLLEDIKVLAKKSGSGLPLGDIYCGVGTFAAFLRSEFDEAELVEENKTALALAKENTGSLSYRYYGLKTDDWIKHRKPFAKPWGLMIVDPPRTGLGNTMRQFLAQSSIKTLAYVSCDPATLARDSKDLIAAGFELKELGLYDFYPQTSHIESLAVFVRAAKNEK